MKDERLLCEGKGLGSGSISCVYEKNVKSIVEKSFGGQGQFFFRSISLRLKKKIRVDQCKF